MGRCQPESHCSCHPPWPINTRSPDIVEKALRSDFGKQGVTNVRFFWEKGCDGGSSVVYVTRNHAFGPFGLATSRKEVPKAAAQLLFEVKRGLH